MQCTVMFQPYQLRLLSSRDNVGVSERAGFLGDGESCRSGYLSRASVLSMTILDSGVVVCRLFEICSINTPLSRCRCILLEVQIDTPVEALDILIYLSESSFIDRIAARSKGFQSDGTF